MKRKIVVRNKVKNEIHLPKTYRKIDLSVCENWKAVSFLKERGIGQNTIEALNIGYTEWNDPEPTWSNRIVVPSYDADGSLTAYAGYRY